MAWMYSSSQLCTMTLTLSFFDFPLVVPILLVGNDALSDNGNSVLLTALINSHTAFRS